MKTFFKPNPQKIFLSGLILLLVVLFFLPVTMNVLCSLNSPCPPMQFFIKINEVSSPRFVSINYFYLLIEALISYTLTCSLIAIYHHFKKTN
jgi:hypothetical protein